MARGRRAMAGAGLVRAAGVLLVAVGCVWADGECLRPPLPHKRAPLMV